VGTSACRLPLPRTAPGGARLRAAGLAVSARPQRWAGLEVAAAAAAAVAAAVAAAAATGTGTAAAKAGTGGCGLEQPARRRAESSQLPRKRANTVNERGGRSGVRKPSLYSRAKTPTHTARARCAWPNELQCSSQSLHQPAPTHAPDRGRVDGPLAPRGSPGAVGAAAAATIDVVDAARCGVGVGASRCGVRVTGDGGRWGGGTLAAGTPLSTRSSCCTASPLGECWGGGYMVATTPRSTQQCSRP
jgi:hypothetical protein